jgi:hypothetical protein
MSDVQPTVRTAVRRHKERARFDREQIYSILDEGMVCHLACHAEQTTWMIPTAYGRRADELFVHGAAGNHLLKAAAAGAQVVATVTLVDGMVLAKSTFSHSLNYRSVVIFGQAEEVREPADKAAVLALIVEHLLPGRTREAREPTDAELASTRVLRLPISEVSAKVRTGPPLDGPADSSLPVWSGVIPLRTTAGTAVPADGSEKRRPTGSWLLQPGRWLQAD